MSQSQRRRAMPVPVGSDSDDEEINPDIIMGPKKMKKSTPGTRRSARVTAPREQVPHQSESSEEEDARKTSTKGKQTGRSQTRAANKKKNLSEVTRGRGRKEAEEEQEEEEVMDQDDDSEKENRENGSTELSGTEDEEAAGPQAESPEDIDHVRFFTEYNKLIKAARRLGDDLDMTEDFQEGNTMVEQNIESASRLVSSIGCDPSKAVTAFTHVLAITETASLNVRKCGNVSSHFSYERYLESLKNTGVAEDGEYDRDHVHKTCSEDVRTYAFRRCQFVSLLGVVNITPEETVEAPKEKKKRSITKRANFDETAPATQHQVVNSQVRKNASNDPEKDSVSESLRKAEQLKKLCKNKRKPSVSLFEYGLQKSDTIQTFVTEVFTAAVLTRDGCARIFEDEADAHRRVSTRLINPLDAKLQVQAAQPPDVTEEGFELNRTQHIVSLNSKAIKALLVNPSAST